MAKYVGDAGSLVAGGSGFLNSLLNGSSGSLGAASFSVIMSVPEEDNTEPGSGLASRSYATGMGTWEIPFSARFPQGAGQYGNKGSLTYASGYDDHVYSWDMALQFAVMEATEFGDWLEYIPGIYSWGGSYQARADDTTAISPPDVGETSAAAFSARILDETDDCILSGNILATRAETGIDVNSAEAAGSAFSYRGVGNLTQSDATTPLFPNDAALTKSDAVTVTGTLVGGRTIEGTAMARDLRLVVPAKGLVQVSGTLQGSGEPTIG